jgi:hypothetical protein
MQLLEYGAMLGIRALVLLSAFVLTGCGPSVDLTQALEITDVSSGWLDAGIVGGQNKLVPSISFRLKNVSTETLPSLQVNAVFRRANEPEDWGSAFLRITGSEGLEAGATTELIRAKSQLGYTGSEPRAVMLENSHFVDARVDLFAKYASVQWVRIGEHTIDRRLLTGE